MSSTSMMSLTAAEIDAAMAVNAGWSFPGVEDGWMKAHNAIRLDMSDFSEALSTCMHQLKQGRPLQPWMIGNIRKWWPIFAGLVHHHHDNEELIVIPGLAKLGVSMPEKITADHPQLMADMERVTSLIKSLAPGRPADVDMQLFASLSIAFEGLRSMMVEHLKEEEDVCLPLMRKHVTHKQFVPIEKQIIAKATPEMLGWVLRPFANDAARKQWMTEVAGIPGIVQALVMLPAARKYCNNIARLVLEVKAGEKLPRESGCLC